MNLVVHGLDASNIRQGNTFYDQIDHLVGQCAFVMANPPFNVDGVDTKKVAAQVNTIENRGRLPFGLPGTNAKTGAISNANSLWIQYFYAYLNDTGRAGFVMASSASDAGNKDRDIREKLIRTGHVDVMMAIGNKFFYTRSLPCTLWFFDKGKPEHLRDRVLMIDARNVYHVVSARSHVFTDEQLANLTAIVWLHRGEQDKFVALLQRYQRKAADWLATLPERLAADAAAVQGLAAPLQGFAARFADTSAAQAMLTELNADQPEDKHLTSADLDRFTAEAAAAQAEDERTAQVIADTLAATESVRQSLSAAELTLHASLVAAQGQLDDLAPRLKSLTKALEARHKQWLKLLDGAEKTLRARQSSAYDAKAIREARRGLLPADAKKNEAPTVRDAVLNALKQAVYFIHQGHWLHSRFPHAVFENVAGLCKAVTIDEIAASDYSLTPGHYVGVAPAASDDDEDFAEKLREIHDELAELNERATELATRILRNFEELLR
jgi:type I restriction enzyme M protein